MQNEKPEITQTDHEKRNQLKGLVALVAVGSAPWSKPMVNSVLLPAHAQTSPPVSGGAGAGTGTARMSFTVTDPGTNVSSPSTAPFGFRVGMVNTNTGEFEVTILPTSQMTSLTPGSGFLDWFMQSAIAQTGNQIIITGGSLTGTVDLVDGGEATAEGKLILGTGEGVACDCPVEFTVQYNVNTGTIEFDQAGFELDYDISEFIGTCAALNLNLTELGGVMITTRPENIVVIPPATSTGFAPEDAAEFHSRFNAALRTPGVWWSSKPERILELSPDGTTAREVESEGKIINYTAGWSYVKTGDNTGTLSLMDDPSDATPTAEYPNGFNFERTLEITFESERTGYARHVEYDAELTEEETPEGTTRLGPRRYFFYRRFDWREL